MNNYQKYFKSQVMILVVVLMAGIFALAVSSQMSFLLGLRQSRLTIDSVKAFYAADSGVEAALYQAFVGHSCSTPVSGEVSGGSGKYTYNVDITGANCEETGTSMISIGTYKPDGTNASSTRRLSIGY